MDEEALRQQVYVMTLGADPEASSEQICEELPALISQAAQSCLPQGVAYQDCQIVLGEEPLAEQGYSNLWKGQLLINALLEGWSEEQYQEWNWRNGRKDRNDSFNQALVDGADRVFWVELRAV